MARVLKLADLDINAWMLFGRIYILGESRADKIECIDELFNKYQICPVRIFMLV